MIKGWKVSSKEKTKDQKQIEVLLKMSGFTLTKTTKISVHNTCQQITTLGKHKKQLDEFLIYQWPRPLKALQMNLSLLKPCSVHLKDYLENGWSYL